ncbi:hypothetical protein M422DRAFT_35524 [Sphaerobolus stellatus SS14]|uniref:Uncharacterized protein n=1 Tax=Sphaerobolus stellatus (strain SS14) TaxID=990650 RepID=A0A0C9UW10_SPHS4|nr:hypothetical protein M422DRAFT_35524 [Sphaerobolus stellatus SS14]
MIVTPSSRGTAGRSCQLNAAPVRPLFLPTFCISQVSANLCKFEVETFTGDSSGTSYHSTVEEEVTPVRRLFVPAIG